MPYFFGICNDKKLYVPAQARQNPAKIIAFRGQKWYSGHVLI